MCTASRAVVVYVLVALTGCSLNRVTFRTADEDCSITGDEDGNGLADCADPACASAPSCTQSPTCGDGHVDTGEQCDDGNTVNGDACDTNCTLPACGNKAIDPGEDCDTGGATLDCNLDCTLSRCGDGKLNPAAGEQCDDGNATNGDACDSNCTTPRCGNMQIDPGEDCDTGSATADCDLDCTRPVCGDGQFNPAAGEECDDGNTTSGDTCSSTCKLPRCGDGILDPGEELDPPTSASQVVPANTQTCRYDFSAVTQLYCAGTCGTWGTGLTTGDDCGQLDADAFCKLKSGNPNSTASTFVIRNTLAAPGICCPNEDPAALGCVTIGTFLNRGVQQRVSVNETNLLASHHGGTVITDVVCTP